MSESENLEAASAPTESSSEGQAPSFEEAASRVIDEATAESSTEAEAPKAAAPQPDVFTWDKAHPEAKKQYEQTKQSYENMRREFDRRNNEWKAEQEKFKTLKDADQKLAYFNRLYETNQEVKGVLDRALGVKPQVDPTLEQDPLYKFIQEREQKISGPLNQVMQWMQEQQSREQEAKLNAEVDRVTSVATETYKELMQKDADPETVKNIYKFMVDRKIYDGEAAVKAMMFQDAIKSARQAALEEQMAKKTKGSNLSSVSTAKAKPNGQASSFEEAFEAASKQLGINW